MRTRSRHWVKAMLIAAGIVSLAASGCAKTDPGQRDRVIENAPDPVGEARSVLQAYAAGGPMGSEASMFDDLSARVKAVDAAKAEVFATFAKEAMQSPEGLAERAKKALASF
jgi:hypothetical protein